MYSTVEAVLRYTGVKPKDLGLVTTEELDAVITGWLGEVKSLIDADRGRDYDAEVAAGTRAAVPAGIHGIARELAAKIVRLAIVTRTTPVVQVNDFEVRVAGEPLLTKDIRMQLSRFPRKAGLRFNRVRSTAEVEAAAEDPV